MTLKRCCFSKNSIFFGEKREYGNLGEYTYMDD